MKKSLQKITLVSMFCLSLLLGGCSGNVGVGLNVGVPIGNHGYMNIGTGTNRWY